MVLIIGFLEIAAWFIVFALLCVFGIILIVKGTKRVKNGKFPAPAGSQKQKFPPVLYIVAGIILIAISIMILFAILDCFLGNDISSGSHFYYFLDKSLELFMAGFKIICVFSAVCPLLIAVFFWVEGIRMARKLKSIDDVDTYNKKLKLSFLLIFLGVLGIGVSILSLRALIQIIFRI